MRRDVESFRKYKAVYDRHVSAWTVVEVATGKVVASVGKDMAKAQFERMFWELISE